MLLSRTDILVNQKGKDGVTALGLACLQVHRATRVAELDFPSFVFLRCLKKPFRLMTKLIPGTGTWYIFWFKFLNLRNFFYRYLTKEL